MAVIKDEENLDFLEKLPEAKCARLWERIVLAHQQNLASKGVKLPSASFKVRNRPEVTAKAWALIALTALEGKTVSIPTLSEFIKGKIHGWVGTQQVRHLSSQDGWNIGNKNDIDSNTGVKVRSGWHTLFNLTEPKKSFCACKRNAREFALSVSFEELKALHDNRCYTCGSREGEPIWGHEDMKCELTKGHMDPADAATQPIPQCQICNNAKGNRFVYDERGRVVTVASYTAVKKARPEVKRSILENMLVDANEETLDFASKLIALQRDNLTAERGLQ